MQSFEQFADAFNEVSKQVRAQYKDEEHGNPPVCHVLHREIDLQATKPDDVEEQVERVRRMFAAQSMSEEQVGNITEDDLDFTEEHRKLHGFFARFINEAQFQGISPEEIAMTLLLVGRRMGLREAAEAFGSFGGDNGAAV